MPVFFPHYSRGGRGPWHQGSLKDCPRKFMPFLLGIQCKNTISDNILTSGSCWLLSSGQLWARVCCSASLCVWSWCFWRLRGEEQVIHSQEVSQRCHRIKDIPGREGSNPLTPGRVSHVERRWSSSQDSECGESWDFQPETLVVILRAP